MFQAYYQAHLFAATFLQPTVSYIPTPGAAPDLPPAPDDDDAPDRAFLEDRLVTNRDLG